MDIDNFKSLNTKFSNRVVDKDILSEFQRILVAATLYNGFVYAEGGDEVIILLPNVTLNMAKAFADDLQVALSGKKFSVNATDIHITVSMGISHSENKEMWPGLPEEANLAMLEAKELGKNRICLHKGNMKKAALSVALA